MKRLFGVVTLGMGNDVLRFTKLHGLGNDFVLIAGSESSPPPSLGHLSQQLLDRRHGCGGDQLLWLGNSAADQDQLLRIYNPDGSEAEMCGNGVRAAALWLLQEQKREAVVFATLAGRISTQAVPSPDGKSETPWFRVGMGVPQLYSPLTLEILGTSVTGVPVDMGNPHFVVRELPAELRNVPLETWGRALETHPAFPERTNVEWVRPIGPTNLSVEVWERGAGLTLACGTGACASAVAALTHHWMSGTPLTVTLPGGPLQIEWEGPGKECFQTGPAVRVFDAQVYAAL